MVRRKIRNAVVGASSMLDISGHSRASEPRRKSVRIKTSNRFYTDPVSDAFNVSGDWAVSGSDIAKSIIKLTKYDG